MQSIDRNNRTPYRILTVGDGDITFSLALKRAYPGVSVTASTLIKSSTELLNTYSNAGPTVEEFCNVWNEEIFYAVDATRLIECETLKTKKFDAVMFNHPHLGDATLHISEKHHAQRHHVLLCHYFHSARSIIVPTGRIHVCLCSTQPTTWNVVEAASRNGLTCVTQEGTTPPLHTWLFQNNNSISLAEVEKHYPCKRKYRNGKLGSKHFLGRYGYGHRRTGGDLYGGNVSDMAVPQSVNFVFALEKKDSNMNENETNTEREEYVCNICGLGFRDKSAFVKHLEAPAMPDIMTGNFIHPKITPPASTSQDVRQSKSLKETISTEPTIEFDEASKLMEITVEQRYDSKRIKWLFRQEDFPLSTYVKTKKQCKDIIKSGRIFINRDVVQDDSRIVRCKDVITLVRPIQRERDLSICPLPQKDLHGVRIVKTIPIRGAKETCDILVAHKPVGVRVVGSFAPNTLEMLVKSILSLPSVPKAISKLETGCGGLCVLSTSVTNLDIEIKYKFTLLVHGIKPEWRHGVYVKIPDRGPRNWKRKMTNNKTDVNDEALEDTDYDSSEIKESSLEMNLNESLFIKCIDTLSNSSTKLSTLEVLSTHNSGRLTNVISFVLRKLGYPVVNDRFCKREFAELPRAMRNTLKQKICICCDSLEIKLQQKNNGSGLMVENVAIDPSTRNQCAHWRNSSDFCS